MDNLMHRDMLEATRLTRAGQLAEATALLQRLLRGETTASDTVAMRDEPAEASPQGLPCLIDLVPDQIEEMEARPSERGGELFRSGAGGRATPAVEPTASAHMPDALEHDPEKWIPLFGKRSCSTKNLQRDGDSTKSHPAVAGFLDRIKRLGPALGRTGPAHPPFVREPEILPDGAQFVAGSYSEQVGTCAYKLYIPSGYHGQALPLIVMLHGCTQSPDDFAAGTRMNDLAEEHTCLVVYPAQSTSANCSKCWNWFSPEHQQRDRGEPALIAGITRQVMRDYAVDPRRVYVAGLSAGAAAAAIMGMAYPDLYAAIGVHSGLACGAASDLPSAFAAMRDGNGMAEGHEDAEQYRPVVPTIVFHGDQDTTVNPCNGDQIIARTKASVSAGLRTSVEHGQASGGHAYSRTLYIDAGGRTVLEQWIVRDAGHAWSGGSSAGSYTDPLGPDASREMLRFFLEHAHAGGA